ncbi:D-alanyl-D-alanine carboxypeptidase/D-alanyl-D-alanine-endopeptidase [Nocardioides sp.]|uniref:D-alanyl-D-alanine carboxypeptidase/D-alanyl-D-alanine endopeptidase n=1 Tax=Nocardioides sp. TaxID=35761 RepID=UPI002621B6FC|nr:D-alanyl-D-alanine carboxypeptidase/D-alanyl-D-alanine-endopeptidase [Nocardioides sp.]
MASLLVLAVVAAVGVVGYDRGWFDRWLDSDPAAGADSAAEPWNVAVPSPSAVAASTSTLDAAKVRAALKGHLKAADLGDHVVGEVSSISGATLASFGTGSATPASTTKLLTAAAALHVLGPEATFATTVVSPAAGQLVLVGGGDPLLALKPVKSELLPRADVTTLARTAAAALKASGVTRVRLSYDDSLFTGPTTSPSWPANYVPDDVVSPMSALRLDEGQLDDGRDLTPATTAARKVAAVLRAEGITVAHRIRKAAVSTAGTDTEIARVTSAPLRDIVQHTLETSDNDAAETMAHLIGAKAGDGSFAGGVKATTAALTDLGVPLDGVRLYDGSGLSRKDLITPAALTGVLRAAATDPDLQSLGYGLPVAGFSGSLLERFTDASGTAGLGVVRAKTGTLTGVSALAGFIADADGTPMVYVVMADEVPVTKTLAARSALDDAAAALATCHCSTPAPATPSTPTTPATPAIPSTSTSPSTLTSDQPSATVAP